MILEVVLIILVALFLHKMRQKPKNLPPGEFGYPIIGAPKPKGVTLNQYVTDLKKKYGPIYSLQMGSNLTVVLADYDVIKRGLSKPELQGRPYFFTYRIFMHHLNKGIIISDGLPWSNGRRFALRHLRDFGLGKTRLQDTVMLEAEALIADFKKTLGTPTEPSWNINVAVLNVIWSLTAARRYNIDDPEIHQFSKRMNESLNIIQGPAILLDLYPWMLKIVPKKILDIWMKTDRIEKTRDSLDEFLMKIVDQHKKSLNPNCPKDFIDMYLLEIEAQKDNPNSTFLEDCTDLIAIIFNLFVAGSETTSSTLRWLILYLAKYPDVQKKIQEEIDSVASRDRLPSMEDKEKLNYLEAVIHEIHRIISFLPFGLVHRATEETTLEGYTIPKDALIMPLLEVCHHDEQFWEKPDTFYPEHFLDEEGKFIAKKDGFLPFALGRRQCLGESLARMVLFIFSAALLQKFSITAPPDEPLDTEIDGSKTLLNFVKPFKIILEERK